MRPTGWSTLAVASTVGVLASCTFPDITIGLSASTGAGGASTSSSTSGTGGAGASMSVSASSSAGTGGAGATGGGACSEAGVGGAGGVIQCDADGDDAGAAGPPCCGNDCDDSDPETFWGQGKYFDKPRINGGGFDYNCSGMDERDKTQLFKQNGTLDCSGTTDCVMFPAGYTIDAVCGKLDADNYWQCQGTALNCNAVLWTPTEKLRCH